MVYNGLSRLGNIIFSYNDQTFHAKCVIAIVFQMLLEGAIDHINYCTLSEINNLDM